MSSAISRYESLLQCKPKKIEKNDEQGIETVFFELENVMIELLGSIRPDSTIAKFLKKKGEGIHHIALATDRISNEMDRLSKLGIKVIDSKPRKGSHNTQIAFAHPKDLHGVLVELVQ
jgi:methylmalonyl-CoA/ethylmalonyl-CoA epimerase